MKILYTVFAILLFAAIAFGQAAKSTQPKFDIADFNKKFETAQWLVEYDNVAWKTTDAVMAMPKDVIARLGQDWFCFQDTNKIWHAVYGGLTEGKYDVAIHLEMDAKEKITKSNQKIDQEFLNKHARALKTGRDKLTARVADGSPRFNQFIRQNPDKTFFVWLLPAFQPDRMTVFGGEAVYTVDASGTTILKDDSYFQEGFRGFKSEPPREIWLNYTEQDKPSLGAIFFVWYYKAYFTKIFIENAKGTSTVIKGDSGYIWVHVEKDEPSKTVETEDPARPKLQRKKPSGN